MQTIVGRWYFSLLVVVLGHSHLPVFAQGEFNNWFFGNKAGISFATVPLSNLVGYQMTTVTSTVSVSDSNGVLQFYSNGWHVYDRNHGIIAKFNCSLDQLFNCSVVQLLYLPKIPFSRQLSYIRCIFTIIANSPGYDPLPFSLFSADTTGDSLSPNRPRILVCRS
jgi:hypothetical protein